MRKFFFLFFSLMAWSLFAQVPQTFVPDESKVYYFKSQAEGSGRNTSFIGETIGDITISVDETLEDVSIIQNMVMDTESVIDNNEFGWKISYVDEKGYMIKNLETGLYWKYIGSYDGEGKTNGQNFIYLAELDQNEIERYYFEFRESNAPAKIGNSEYTFEIQGYLIVCVGSMEDQSLDAYSSTNLGTWKFENTTKNNQIWWPMAEDDLLGFQKGLDAAKFPFLPNENDYFYIKTAHESRGIFYRYVAQSATADTLRNLDISNTDVKSYDLAKWYFEIDKEEGIYRIKNKATGKYLMFTGDPGEKNAFGLVGVGDIIAGDEDRFALIVKKSNWEYIIGLKGHDEIATFVAQPYYIGFNYSPSQGLNTPDDYGSGKDRISTWDNGVNDSYVNWFFMTDKDVDDLVAAREAASFVWEEDAVYTIRPNNYSKTYPNPDPTEEDLEDYEKQKNSRIGDGEDGWIYFLSYDLDDDAIKWNIIPTESGKYRFSNVMTNNFLTVGKWYAGQGESALQISMDAVTASPYDGSDKNQELSIVFKGYRLDEYNKAVKIFAIANENEFSEPVDGEGKVIGKEKFYLDALNGESLVMHSPGSWGGSGSGNQQFIIRVVEKDQPGSSIGKDVVENSKTTVTVSGKNVTVNTDLNSNISVYSVNGTLVKETKETKFSIAQSGFYIIKVDQEAFKVIIK